MESRLIQMCIEAATESRTAIEAWRRQRRSLERMPPQLAQALLHRLLRRRLLFPSLLEVFKHSIEDIDLRSENCVDAEWMAYLGSFKYLRALNLADCYKINSAALWSITGMSNLKELDLSRCSKVADAGIRHLLSIPVLEKLCISETGVTASGIQLLSSLTNLCVLDLGGLPVTDLALSSLKGLRNLQYLDLWGSEISSEGAALFEALPRLTFLNVAWTRVTKLPSLQSLKYLNMSNCTVHSLFEGEGDRPRLQKLMLSGATLADAFNALSGVGTSGLSFLDLSNTLISSFSFLPLMKTLTYLDLSSSSILDESVDQIAQIGAKLRYLNLIRTKVSSVGVGILAGHVPNLETILLSNSCIDDIAVPYIGLMPSLKVVDLSSTQIKGLTQRGSPVSTCVPSFTALQSLSYLESLDLGRTPIQDTALCPLSSLCSLRYLSLGSGYLTDACLHYLSSVQNLVHLAIHDAVLTNSGIQSFSPPPTLEILDLKGCWLLTEDNVLEFCKKHPNIRLKHEHLDMMPPDDGYSNYTSPPGKNSRISRPKQRVEMLTSPSQCNNSPISDQRLKYTREQLLALQVSPSPVSSQEGMSNLKELDLSRCSKVADAGIRHLLSIPVLEKLCISETGVTASGIQLLSSLTNLCVLDLGGLPVTDLALSSLKVIVLILPRFGTYLHIVS